MVDRRIGLVTALAAGLAPLPSHAQSLRLTLFPSDGACYLRSYTTAHMARHPEQRVTMIAVGPEPAQTTPAALALRVLINTKDSNDFYFGIAYCTEDGAALNCSIEGDGGSFTLTAADGALQLNVGANGMAFEGETDFLEISGRSGDDRVFRLPPVPADSCP